MELISKADCLIADLEHSDLPGAMKTTFDVMVHSRGNIYFFVLDSIVQRGNSCREERRIKGASYYVGGKGSESIQKSVFRC